MEPGEPEETDLILPAIFNSTPLRALRMTSRHKLSGFLDLEGVPIVVISEDGTEIDVLNDSSGLAELAGFTYQEIMNMKRQRSPTDELLTLWTNQQGTVGKLWSYLYMMERHDALVDCRRCILFDCDLYERQQQIKEDAHRYELQQDPTVTTSEMQVDETKFATTHDVKRGGRQIEYYAFICYSPEDEKDRNFVRRMIEELEVKRGLQLFVPGRDDLPGAPEHTINAYLIEKRCKRMVILISKMFLKSAACDFQVKFAHSLAPGARSKLLIPIIHEKETQKLMPRILKFLAVCDFTKPDMEDWVWDRLHSALLAPKGPVTYFEEEYSEETRKDMTYPFTQRLHQLDANSSDQLKQS